VVLLVSNQLSGVYLTLGESSFLSWFYFRNIWFSQRGWNFNIVKINFPFFQCSSSELDSGDGRSVSRHNRGCINRVSVISLFQLFFWVTILCFDAFFINLNRVQSTLFLQLCSYKWPSSIPWNLCYTTGKNLLRNFLLSLNSYPLSTLWKWPC